LDILAEQSPDLLGEDCHLFGGVQHVAGPASGLGGLVGGHRARGPFVGDRVVTVHSVVVVGSGGWGRRSAGRWRTGRALEGGHRAVWPLTATSWSLLRVATR